MLYERREVNLSARNLLCPSYSICLTSAVRNNSTGFCCDGCGRQKTEEPISPDEPQRCGEFLRWLFFQEEEFRWVEMKCPRCGIIYRREVRSADPSPRRFCTACLTAITTVWTDYETGAELRGVPRHWMPVEAKPEESESS